MAFVQSAHCWYEADAARRILVQEAAERAKGRDVAEGWEGLGGRGCRGIAACPVVWSCIPVSVQCYPCQSCRRCGCHHCGTHARGQAHLVSVVVSSCTQEHSS